jgi:hypothetical protein
MATASIDVTDAFGTRVEGFVETYRDPSHPNFGNPRYADYSVRADRRRTRPRHYPMQRAVGRYRKLGCGRLQLQPARKCADVRLNALPCGRTGPGGGEIERTLRRQRHGRWGHCLRPTTPVGAGRVPGHC